MVPHLATAVGRWLKFCLPAQTLKHTDPNQNPMDGHTAATWLFGGAVAVLIWLGMFGTSSLWDRTYRRARYGLKGPTGARPHFTRH